MSRFTVELKEDGSLRIQANENETLNSWFTNWPFNGIMGDKVSYDSNGSVATTKLSTPAEYMAFKQFVSEMRDTQIPNKQVLLAQIDRQSQTSATAAPVVDLNRASMMVEFNDGNFKVMMKNAAQTLRGFFTDHEITQDSSGNSATVKLTSKADVETAKSFINEYKNQMGSNRGKLLDDLGNWASQKFQESTSFLSTLFSNNNK